MVGVGVVMVVVVVLVVGVVVLVHGGCRGGAGGVMIEYLGLLT